MTGFVEAHVARGSGSLLVIGLILLIIGGGLAYLFGNWFPAVIAAPGLVALVFWLIRTVNPGSHPLYKQLARYGDPREVALQVNREFEGLKPAGGAQFGAGWLAQGDTYGLFVAPWPEIAWIHIYTQKRNGLAWHNVRVWSRDGKQCVAPVGTDIQQAEKLLLDLHNRAPWAEVGYTQELMTLWAKQRAEFLRSV